MKMEYNKKTGMFIYRGYEIFPMYRVNGMPASVIRSYYAEERQRIDNLIDNPKTNTMTHSADEDIDFFMDMIGGVKNVYNS